MHRLIKVLDPSAPLVFIWGSLGAGKLFGFPIIQDIFVHRSTETALRIAKDVNYGAADEVYNGIDFPTARFNIGRVALEVNIKPAGSSNRRPFIL